MLQKYYLFLLALILLSCLPLTCFALELRVQDQQGLVRAVRALHGDRAQVEVRTSEQGAGELTLVPESGLGISRQTKRSGGQSFNFADVQAGVWKIDGNYQITQVRIQE